MIALYLQQRALDLEECAKNDLSFNFDGIAPNILALGQVPGTPSTYMIPASWDSAQKYYNKPMFEKAGAPVPADDWTWDQLLAACKTLQQKNADLNCIANGGATGWDWWAYFIPWIVGCGGSPVSVDFKKPTFSSSIRRCSAGSLWAWPRPWPG